MKKAISIKRLICRDCRNAMTPAIIFYSINEVIGGAIKVYTAIVLGAFADSIFNLDVTYGLMDLGKLLFCICINVFLIPFLGTLGEVLMFSNSLKHDASIYARFLDKEYESVIKIEEGEAIYRIEQDSIDFRNSWVNLIVKFCAIPFILTFLLYNAVTISGIFTAIVFAFSVIKLIVPIAVKKLQARYDNETREYNMFVRIYETALTQKPYIIKLYGLFDSIITKLENHYQNYYKKVLCRKSRCNAVAGGLSDILDTVCIVGILFSGALMVAKSVISTGAVAEMIGYFYVFNLIIENVDFIIRNIPIFNNLVERMEVLYADSEGTSGDAIESVLNISVENVSFSYGEKAVLKDVCFDINAGSKAAIYGENGKGKSTLIKILCGLLKDYTGKIKIGGCDLSEIAINSWRQQFAYVNQSPYLFEGSVRENVHLGNLDATDKDVDAVMEKIGIGHLACRQVSVNQNNLSGGEKQKISLARALLKDAPFLFLDEPGNNLDVESNQIIYNFITKSSKTIVFISHDKKLAEAADKRITL